jgi:hypothetical protein
MAGVKSGFGEGVAMIRPRRKEGKKDDVIDKIQTAIKKCIPWYGI